jgi:hypothetical protein
MRKLQLLFFTVGIFFSAVSNSQSVSPSILNVTGGTNMFTFYRIEWSFGEATAIATLSSPNLIVTSGVLQPGTDRPATVNNTTAWDRDEIKILPNPTQSWLEIDFFSKQQGNVTLTLFDEAGRSIVQRQFTYYGTGSIQKMDLTSYPNGQYFLNIRLDPSGTSVAKRGTYKVQKLR